MYFVYSPHSDSNKIWLDREGEFATADAPLPFPIRGFSIRCAPWRRGTASLTTYLSLPLNLREDLKLVLSRGTQLAPASSF
jgi:hypothetical protein